MKFVRLIVGVLTLLGVAAVPTVAQTPTLSLEVVAVNGVPVPGGPTGNIDVMPGDVLTMEIFVRDWSPQGQALRGYQVNVDFAGMASGEAGTMYPVDFAATTDLNGLCTEPPGQIGLPNDDNAFVDLARVDWVHQGPTAFAVVDSLQCEYRFASAVFLPNDSPFSAQDGTKFYTATMMLEVSPDARGAFTLCLVPLGDTDGSQLLDENSLKIEPLALECATVTIPVGRCCIDIGGDTPGCVDGLTDDECASETGLTFFAADQSCTGDIEVDCIPPTTMTCQLAASTVPAEGTIPIDVFLNNVDDLRAYQTRIDITPTSGTGTVSVGCPDGVEVDESREDYIFLGQSPTFPAVDCVNMRLGSAIFSGGVSVAEDPAYLGTFFLDVSPDAGIDSTFDISILTGAADSFLRDSNNDPIPFAAGLACTLTIGVCEPLTVEAVGARYLAITPPASEDPVALHVGSPDEPCVDAFVDFDTDPDLAALGIARLVEAPVMRTPAEWGVVYLSDMAILPQTSYAVSTSCFGALSAESNATTWPWGDVNNSGGLVDFDDILCTVDAFGGHFANCSLFAVDLLGEVTNGGVDFDDVLAVLEAFGGALYPGTDPCE